MEAKKTERVDLNKNTGLYFLIGLNISLLLILGFIEGFRSYDPVDDIFEEVALEPLPIDENVIITERVITEPPPPVENVPPPEIPMELEEVDDDVEIEEPKEFEKQDDTPIQKPTFSGDFKEIKSDPLPSNPGKPAIDENKDDNIYDKLSVAVAPVWPGCEKYANDNSKLLSCFSEKYNSSLSSWLSEVQTDGVVKFYANVYVNKNGGLELKDTRIVGTTNKSVEKEILSAFNRVSSQMERKGGKGKGIEPPKNQKGQPVTMKYSHSITIKPQ